MKPLTTREQVIQSLQERVVRLGANQLVQPYAPELTLEIGNQVLQWVRRDAIPKFDPLSETGTPEDLALIRTFSSITPTAYFTVIVDDGAGDWSEAAEKAEGNHMWLNAAKCIFPSNDFLMGIGQDILNNIRLVHQMDGRQILFCSANKS